jgi:RNA polymerase sigma-70 factor
MGSAGDLHEGLERAVDAAAAAWPGLDGDRVAFRRRLEGLVAGEASPALALTHLHLADLYLAHECSRRTPQAIAIFAARHLSRVDEYVKKFRPAGVCPDEVRRELEDVLLLGRRGAPRIGQYTGRGALAGFVAAAARNAALTQLRQTPREMMADLKTIDHPAANDGSVKRLAARQYEAVISDALRAGLQSLELRQRTIVRLHMSRGVTLTQIGRMLGLHQSTVSRSLDAALHHLCSEVRRRLHQAYGLGNAEIESIIHDIRSQISLTGVSTMLRDTAVGSRVGR